MGLGGDWEIRQINDGRVISDLCGDGGTTIGTMTPLTGIGRWYHFAATFDSSNDTYAIYVDGKLETSGTNSVAMNQQAAAVLSFGTRTGSTEYWQGALRDVRVYSRRLMPPKSPSCYGLVGHWKMDETSGMIAADSSGIGRNATVVGTPTWMPAPWIIACVLNGTTRVEVPSLLGPPKNVTLSAWARLTAADSDGAEVVSIGDYFAIRLNETATTSRAFFYNGSTWVSRLSESIIHRHWLASLCGRVQRRSELLQVLCRRRRGRLGFDDRDNSLHRLGHEDGRRSSRKRRNDLGFDRPSRRRAHL